VGNPVFQKLSQEANEVRDDVSNLKTQIAGLTHTSTPFTLSTQSTIFPSDPKQPLSTPLITPPSGSIQAIPRSSAPILLSQSVPSEPKEAVSVQLSSSAGSLNSPIISDFPVIFANFQKKYVNSLW
jgi:hypothetical protein